MTCDVTVAVALSALATVPKVTAKAAVASAAVAVVDAVAVMATVPHEVTVLPAKVVIVLPARAVTVHHVKLVIALHAKVAIALYAKATALRVKSAPHARNVPRAKAKRPASHAKTVKAVVNAANVVAVAVVTALHATATAPRAAMPPQPKH